MSYLCLCVVLHCFYVCAKCTYSCVFVRCILNSGTINILSVSICVCSSPLLLLTSSQSGHLPQSASADFLHTTAHCFNPSSSHPCCNRSKPSKEYSLKTNRGPFRFSPVGVFCLWGRPFISEDSPIRFCDQTTQVVWNISFQDCQDSRVGKFS